MGEVVDEEAAMKFDPNIEIHSCRCCWWATLPLLSSVVCRTEAAVLPCSGDGASCAGLEPVLAVVWNPWAQTGPPRLWNMEEAVTWGWDETSYPTVALLALRHAVYERGDWLDFGGGGEEEAEVHLNLRGIFADDPSERTCF